MRQQARTDSLTICYRRKNLIDVSFSCVCPVIDHESRHNIVKVVNWSSQRILSDRLVDLHLHWQKCDDIYDRRMNRRQTHEKLTVPK